jgi:hypothetical protein
VSVGINVLVIVHDGVCDIVCVGVDVGIEAKVDVSVRVHVNVGDRVTEDEQLVEEVRDADVVGVKVWV